MMDIRVERVCFGQELVMTSGGQWNDVEIASQLPELSNQLEMSVKFHHTHLAYPWN